MNKTAFSVTEIQAEIQALIALYTTLKNDDGKISLADAWQIFQLAIEDLANLATTLNVANDQKKQLILDALNEVFDQVISGVELNYVPKLLIPIVDKVLKELFLNLASGVLNKIFPTATQLRCKLTQE